MRAQVATTLEETLVAGEVARVGALRPYRRLASGPGEPRRRRDDLGIARGSGGVGGGGRPRRQSLAYLAHVSDLQLADVCSPGRFEFLESLRGLPRTRSFVPAFRPQEALLPHAAEATLRGIASLSESRDTGARLELVLSTGDSLDNAQWNELAAYLSLLGGGTVDLGGGRPYAGVQSLNWPGELFWRPDGGDDPFRRDLGFPTVPGLLERAWAGFVADGLDVAWCSCFGNHDGLAFGESIPTPAYRAAVVGSRKAVALPAGFDPLSNEEALFDSPELFLAGPAVEVAADASRSVVGRREFVEAHLRAPGLPVGHGFDARNLAEGTAYGVVDLKEAVRVVLLDTTNLDGRSDGSLGRRQLAWLEERLAECHEAVRDEAGRAVPTGGRNRLVVLASHHGLAAMTNDRELPGGLEDDHPRVTAAELRRFLHRFPNVVLWLNGHRHLNEVVARPAPDGSGGFWEVSTCALADWPSQARLVEIVANGDGTLSVLCTMVDHPAPADPRDADGLLELAALHRELAANAPTRGLETSRIGGPLDRNVELLLRAPFELD